jgi:hypothetical protein
VHIPEESWAWLTTLAEEDVWACPFTTIRHVPKRAREDYSRAHEWAQQGLRGDSERTWRIWALVPRLLLAPLPGERGKTLPAAVVRDRSERFLRGEWEQLYAHSMPSAAPWPTQVTHARLFHDVVALVKEGQLSKAVARLDPAVLAGLTEETLESLRSLHPLGTPLPAPRISAPLQLDEDAMEAELRALPVASGGGVTQLRFEHLDVVRRCAGTAPFMHACQLLVNNDVPDSVLAWLMGARLLALQKPNGGIRPIACGEVLRRLTNKVVCRQMKEAFGAFFCPAPRPGAASSVAQVGVATPGGAEIAIHTIRTYLEANPFWCCLQIDCANAFNLLRRSAILNSVAAEFPALLPIAEASCRHSYHLGWRHADGSYRWVASEQGTQQGDPLGPFFMALPLQGALEATLAAFPDVIIIAYLDDIHVLGPPDRVRAAYAHLEPALGELGLSVNVDKSKVYSPSGPCAAFADVAGPDGPIPGSADALPGLLVLGVPVGDADWSSSECLRLAARLSEVNGPLGQVPDAQTQSLLLQYCAHPRFIHLLRGVPSRVLQPASLAHDTNIQGVLRVLCSHHGPLPEEAIALSQQPMRWGGRGLTSAQRLSAAGYLGSWALAWATMTTLFPSVAQLLPHMGAEPDTAHGPLPTAQDLLWAKQEMERNRSLVRHHGLSPGQYPPGARPTVSLAWADFAQPRDKLQKEFSTLSHAADFTRLYQALPAAGQARLLSLSRPKAVSFTRAVPCNFPFTLCSGSMTVASCLQLGLPQPALRGSRICACGATNDPLGYHYAICKKGGWVVRAHNAVRDTLYSMLRTVYDPSSVIKEHARHHDYSPLKRPDITVHNYDGRGNNLIVDVAITFPCAASVCRQASTRPLYAAKRMEGQKRDAYGDLGSHRLVPFVLETFGAWGPAAEELFSECTEARRNRLGQEADLASWATRSFGSFWRQRLAVSFLSTFGRGFQERGSRDWRG